MDTSTVTNPSPARCPACGRVVPVDAPGNLCPSCALAGAVRSTKAGPLEPGAGPSLAEVRAAFPQLEVLELIGRGGMGFVYKVRQPELDRLVALKLLPAPLARDPAFVERFTREARALGRLAHPGIVSVHEFGQAGGFCYLMMEFVDGVNLRQAMQAGRFSAAEALAIVPKICAALQYAHDQGVLHRDIKPENILLDARGGVKIADFGIAKLSGHDSSRAGTLTQSGARLGTPNYMAPEQIEKPADVDHRADIYSLGVVFYELLTGELPLGRFAPPSGKTELDARVDAIVMRALSKERELRQQSAGEVKTEVETVVASPVAPGAADSGPARVEAPTQPFLFDGIPMAWKPWLLFGLGLIGTLLTMQAVRRLVPLGGAVLRQLLHLRPIAWTAVAPTASTLVMLGCWAWQKCCPWRRVLSLQPAEPSSWQDRWLGSAGLLLLTGLAGGMIVGLGSVGLVLLPQVDSVVGGFLVLLANLLLWLGIFLKSGRRGQDAFPIAGPAPAWMRRLGGVFFAVGALALLPVFLGQYWSSSTWHSASLLLFTGLALVSASRGWRRIALVVNWFRVFSGVGSLLMWGLLAGGAGWPDPVSNGLGGWTANSEVALFITALEFAAFALGLVVLERPDACAVFGEGRVFDGQRGLSSLAWITFGLAAASLEGLQWKVAWNVQGASRAEVSAPALVPTQAGPTTVLSTPTPTTILPQAGAPTVGGLPEKLPPGTPSVASLKWHFAWQKTAEQRKRFEVGAVTSLDVLASERDEAVAESEYRGDPAKGLTAQVVWARANLNEARARQANGKATQAEVNEATLALAQAEERLRAPEPPGVAATKVEPVLIFGAMSGEVVLPAGQPTTISEALLRLEKPKNASFKRIVLHRLNGESVRLNLEQILKENNRAADLELRPGDRIEVPPALL